MFIHELPEPAKRIVSLVPSITELLADLDLNRETVGITKFCLRPEARHQKKLRIGGTKTIHINKVIGLHPDLVIANREENTKEDIETLAQQVPVYLTDVKNFYDAISMIRAMGKLTSREEAATGLANQIQNNFNALARFKIKRCLYLIWRAPFMSVGGDSFISDMMLKAGFENVCAAQTRYPQLSACEIADLHPEVILLSSEPYPFTEKHVAELQSVFPSARLICCDGEMFSWYGSRMVLAPAYFDALRYLVD